MGIWEIFTFSHALRRSMPQNYSSSPETWLGFFESYSFVCMAKIVIHNIWETVFSIVTLAFVWSYIWYPVEEKRSPVTVHRKSDKYEIIIIFNIFMEAEINNGNEYLFLPETLSRSSIFIYIRENLEATARGVRFFCNEDAAFEVSWTTLGHGSCSLALSRPPKLCISYSVQGRNSISHVVCREAIQQFLSSALFLIFFPHCTPFMRRKVEIYLTYLAVFQVSKLFMHTRGREPLPQGNCWQISEVPYIVSHWW